jgi:serine/threonine protein kinase
MEGSRWPEAAVMNVMQQAVSAVSYMHQSQIAHRDIKLENFLLVSRSSLVRSRVKLIDFGMSRRFEPGKHMRTVVGTPDYMSPQLLAGRYNELTDVWSCGAMMYVLLTSKWPFSGKTTADIRCSIKRGVVPQKPLRRSACSAGARNLLGKLLEVDTDIRLSADVALKHAWFHS